MTSEKRAHHRSKPLRTLTLSDDAWARLDQAAKKIVRSRSFLVEEFAQTLPAPGGLLTTPKKKTPGP
jgi:hypothetical protein